MFTWSFFTEYTNPVAFDFRDLSVFSISQFSRQPIRLLKTSLIDVVIFAQDKLDPRSLLKMVDKTTDWCMLSKRDSE